MEESLLDGLPWDFRSPESQDRMRRNYRMNFIILELWGSKVHSSVVGVIVGATFCTNGGGFGIDIVVVAVAAGVDIDVVTEVVVADLEFSGASYTWTNRRVGEELTEVKLDRALISREWLHLYYCSSNALIRVGSDHFPINFVVEPKGGRRRKFPFRFEKMWLSHPSLLNCVNEWWNVQVEGTDMFRIAKKLRIVKDKDKIQREGYANDNFGKESGILSKYHSIIAREEIFWRQRSRSLWLKAGDRNTRFFHITTLKHRAANRIDYILKNKTKLEKEDEISEAGVELFKELLKADPMLDPEAQNLMAESIPKVLSEDQNRSLAAIPSNEEIKNTVFSFDGNKASGPNGFPMFFFQTFWDIVEKDVTNVVK
ncbi:uncharacterized protein LOC131079489 [Cryptomeria japonica]|uniref:uncharacterized protein LOC131079489 n=1 Tax=Cryptomeria japonica TaxID=3369 RepID=UPI0027DA3842|nr:uncharacterized protein LOC131079489 [Cryptomeria japonica]